MTELTRSCLRFFLDTINPDTRQNVNLELNLNSASATEQGEKQNNGVIKIWNRVKERRGEGFAYWSATAFASAFASGSAAGKAMGAAMGLSNS